MTEPQLIRHFEPQPAYLVERYVSPLAAGGFATSISKLADRCAATDGTEIAVRYLYSAYLPTEDSCFCLFRAPSAAAVRAVNKQAGFAFDRLVDAVLMRDAANGGAQH